MTNKIINNTKKIINLINSKNINGVVRVYEDDGNVHLDVLTNNVKDVAQIIDSLNIGQVGDGVQYGDIYINGNEFSDLLN